MPIASIRGVDINYEVLGERGPWAALQPGGRRALGGVKSLAEKIAEAGNRVLIYDRRNCGASGVSFTGNSENEVWVEDLRELLTHSTPCRRLSAAARRDAGWRCCWRCAIRRRCAACCCGGSRAALTRPSGWCRTTTANTSSWRSRAGWRRSAIASISAKSSPPTRPTAPG